MALLAESMEVGCGNQGVALLGENLEEKGFGNRGEALLAERHGGGGMGLPCTSKALGLKVFDKWPWQ